MTRERILRAALDQLDEVGIDGLTMRAVAKRLGVAPMTLYHHVASKVDMLDGVAALVQDRVEVPSAGIEPWSERLFALCASFRAVMHAHPNAQALLASLPIGAHGLDLVEAGIACLREAGLDLVAASRAHSQIFSFAVGYVYSEVSGFAGEGTLLGEVDHSCLSPARHPNVTALEEMPEPWDRDDEFRRGFDVVLSGILASLGREAGTREPGRRERRAPTLEHLRR